MENWSFQKFWGDCPGKLAPGKWQSAEPEETASQQAILQGREQARRLSEELNFCPVRSSG